MGRARKETGDVMALAAVAEIQKFGKTQNMGTGVMPVWELPQTARLGSRRLEPTFDLDIQLVERCVSGDEGAWEDLVKTHTRRVYSICYRFVGKDSAAQDLTQEGKEIKRDSVSSGERTRTRPVSMRRTI